jgi:hypothetical protein
MRPRCDYSKLICPALTLADAEIELLRGILLKSYRFISPHSDPMGLSNTEMAAEIMRALERHAPTQSARRISSGDPQ